MTNNDSPINAYDTRQMRKVVEFIIEQLDDDFNLSNPDDFDDYSNQSGMIYEAFLKNLLSDDEFDLLKAKWVAEGNYLSSSPDEVV